MRTKSIIFSILVAIIGVWGKILDHDQLLQTKFMREPSSVTDGHLGQYFNTDFRLPSRCIADEIEGIHEDFINIKYSQTSGVPENLRLMRVGYYGNSNHNRIRVTPNFVIVKKNCEALLRNKVTETNRRYSLGEYRSIGLQFTASRPRPYCSVPIRPSDILCNEARVEDRHMIADILQEQTVDELQEIIHVIKRPAQLWPIDFELNNHLRMYIVEDDVQDAQYPFVEFMGESRIRRAFRSGIDPDRAHALVSGNLKYIQYVPSNESSERTAINAQSFNERLEAIFSEIENMQTIRIGNRNRSVNFNNSNMIELKRYLRSESENLYRYWRSTMTILENNSSSSPRFSSFLHPRELRRMSQERMHEQSYDILIDLLTKKVIEEANRVLFKMDSLEEVLLASSYWWAARQLRTNFGCNEELNAPYEGLERFVQTEYNHQTCRRAYAIRGYLNLNTLIQVDGDFKLDSAEAQLILSVTSRKERGVFYSDAYRYLLMRLQRGENISLVELSQIVSHYFQTLEEKRISRVLTWKGFTDFGDGDADRVETDRINAINFIRSFMDHAYRNKESNIGHFYFAMLLRNKLSTNITEINWNSYDIDESTLLGYLNAMSDDFAFSSVENVRLYEISKNYSKNYSSLNNVCSFWYESMQRRFQTATFEIGSWQQLLNNDMHDCMDLVPAWVARMVQTSGRENYGNSQNLCVSRQDVLACRTVSFGSENKSDWSMERWIEFFSMPRLTQENANEGFTIVLAKWQEVLRGRDRNLKTQWEQFILRIESILATKVTNALQVIPDRETFARCISVENWNNLISANQVLVVVPELSDDCNVQDRDELRNFIVALGYLTKTAFTESIQTERNQAENLSYFITTPVRVYNRWLYLTKDRRMQRALTLTAENVNDVKRRLAVLIDGHNVSFGRTDIFILNYGRQLSSRHSTFFLKVILQETFLATISMQECLRYSNRAVCRVPLDNLFFPDL